MEYGESFYSVLVDRLEELDTFINMGMRTDNDDVRRIYSHVGKALDIAYGLVQEEDEA